MIAKKLVCIVAASEITETMKTGIRRMSDAQVSKCVCDFEEAYHEAKNDTILSQALEIFRENWQIALAEKVRRELNK